MRLMKKHDLISLIMRHLSYLDTVHTMGKNIYRTALRGDLDQVYFDCENRDRLLSVLADVQGHIERRLEAVAAQGLSEGLKDILITWSQEMNQLIEKVNELDEKTTEILLIHKEQTTQEIANVFEAQSKFKGYNLNDVKK